MAKRLRLLSILRFAGVLGGVGLFVAWATYIHFDRTPGELIRYAERRLIGHPKLEAVFLPVFGAIRPYIERPAISPLPTLGKGQQQASLPLQQYDTEGQPKPINTQNILGAAPKGEVVYISSMTELQQAISVARPGQILEISPGTYSMLKSIAIKMPGSADQPIHLRAAKPGTVIIESAALEGFHVLAPFWIFENLTVRGVCKNHGDCEHAFHVVGNAQNVVIRNNRLENFNSQIKVNGLDGVWPDNGLLQFNTIANDEKRTANRPVSLIDIVAVSNWVIADNVISNFIKDGSDRISYGAFFKGGGSDGRLERNLVICTLHDISQPGIRVGLSLGGGGTDRKVCRDGACIAEHTGGLMADNVIVNCNDFGIYINKSNQSRIVGNTLVNTYGIDVRFPVSSADIENNTLDGVIRSRDGALINVVNNNIQWRVDISGPASGQE